MIFGVDLRGRAVTSYTRFRGLNDLRVMVRFEVEEDEEIVIIIGFPLK